MRVSFNYVFQENVDGFYTPKTQVHVNGVTMGPDVSFTNGVLYGGFDIAKYRGKDIDIEHSLKLYTARTNYRAHRVYQSVGMKEQPMKIFQLKYV